jgi:light-regulated signal transduction histidine kinase (bacteriophytochrome)
MPHGHLLLLAPDDYRILGADAQLAARLDDGVTGPWGGGLERIFAPEVRQRLEQGLAQIRERRPPRYLGCHALLDGDARFDLCAHRSGPYLVLELEAIPAAAAERWPTERFAAIAECVSALQAADSWQEVMAIAVRELQRLTGFDSVQGVRFLDNGSAQTIAEARDADEPSFLDMRFPRADIPEPAHRQMLLMPLQYAPDAAYVPVPLLMAQPGQDPREVDLGLAMLRSTSAMCNQFYLNLHTRGRLVLSLVHQGRLWGFFSGWSRTPRYLSYSDRLAYQSFAAMAGLLLVEKDQAEQQRQALAAKRRMAELAAELPVAEGLGAALRNLPARLLDSLDMAGAALCIDDRCYGAGVTPTEPLLKALVSWLDEQAELLVTDRLPSLWEPAAAQATSVTGLCALRLLEPGQYLLGFRPEWVQEVRWAGNPRKPVAIDLSDGGERLTPRGSFAAWTEEVRGLARPWQPHTAEALLDLQRAVILAQHSDKRRILRSLLERSNLELESFAYIVSHDLQEPLRGIRNFSQFLRDRSGDRKSVV